LIATRALAAPAELCPPDDTACAAACAQTPASDLCLITLRFGAPGGRALTALLQRPNLDPLAAAAAQGMTPADARSLAWFVWGIHLVPYPPIPPSSRTLTPQQAQALTQQEHLCESLRSSPAEALLRCHTTLVSMLEAAYGPDDERLVPSLALIGDLRLNQHSTDPAGWRAYQRALTILEATYPTGHPRRLQLQSWVAARAFDAHNYPIARQITAANLTQHEALYGPHHPLTLAVVSQLALLLMETGELDRARPLIERLVRSQQALLGPTHPQVSLAIYQRARLLSRLGDTRAALADYERALSGYAGDPAMRAILLNDLGMAQARVGQLKQAEASFVEALGPDLAKLERIIQTTPPDKRADALRGFNVPTIATALLNLGDLNRIQGNPAGALRRYTLAHALLDALYGEVHPEVIYARGRIADALWAQGKIAAAVAAREAALAALRRTAQPEDHPDRVAALSALALGRWIMGEADAARTLQAEALALIERRLPSAAQAAWHDLQVIDLIANARAMLGRALTYFSRPEDARVALEAVLRWQGLSARLELLRRAQASAPPDAAGLIVGARAEPVAVQPAHLSLETLCAAVRRDGAPLVIYALYEYIAPDKAPVQTAARYDAFILRPDTTCNVERVALGDAAPLHASLKLWRGAVEAAERCISKRNEFACQPAMLKLDEAAQAVGERVWLPIARKLGSPGRVSLATDGALAQVPFGALPDAAGRYMVEDWTPVVWAWPGAMVERGAQTKRGQGALVVGDLDYSAAADEGAPLIAQRCGEQGCAQVTSSPGVTIAQRGSAGLCGYSASWSRLATEAASVAQLLGQSGQEAWLVTGEAATQRALSYAMPGKRVIHLATHGFASSPAACEATDVRAPAGFQPESLPAPRIDPLRLSALVLSGANTLRGDAARDGVLSAREIVGLDLSGVELVALSACQTGLGEVVAGEGTLGLARSFLVAGAEQVIASMWQVPSAPTSALFGALYPLLLTQPAPSPAEALAQAQRTAIKAARDRGAPRSAFGWGAFVVIRR
jgi:CHAT domain-containing protein/tetratricopeptide (TPR) repeat protein